MIKVYAKADAAGRVDQMGSSVFLTDLTGWVQIDEGEGDRYAHAQGNYLEKPLMDADGTHNYILDGSTIREATEEEKAAECGLEKAKNAQNDADETKKKLVAEYNNAVFDSDEAMEESERITSDIAESQSRLNRLGIERAALAARLEASAGNTDDGRIEASRRRVEELAKQAEQMQNISPIDMMVTYDEQVIDITLEELIQYNQKQRSKR